MDDGHTALILQATGQTKPRLRGAPAPAAALVPAARADRGAPSYGYLKYTTYMRISRYVPIRLIYDTYGTYTTRICDVYVLGEVDTHEIRVSPDTHTHVQTYTSTYESYMCRICVVYEAYWYVSGDTRICCVFEAYMKRI